MMSDTVRETCNSIGYATPCYSEHYGNINCVNIVGNINIFTHIQKALCPDASQWTCSYLNEACVYMGRGWRSGSAYCNLNNDDVSGKDYSNKRSLCALEV